MQTKKTTSELPELPRLSERMAVAAKDLFGKDTVSAEELRELVDKLSVNDFLHGLDYIHAEATGGDIREPRNVAPAVLNRYFGSKEAIHAILLHPDFINDFTAFYLKIAQGVKEKTRYANILTYGILLSHLYRDGNGRTARTVAMLAMNGVQPENANASRMLDEFAHARGAGLERMSSFIPTRKARRSWMMGYANEAGKLDQYIRAEQLLSGDEFSSLDQEDNFRFRDSEKIASYLTLTDEQTKLWLQRSLQQDTNGSYVLLDLMEIKDETDAASIISLLGKVNQETATELIRKDRARTYQYSCWYIELLSGIPKLYYAPDGVQHGTMTDEDEIGFH